MRAKPRSPATKGSGPGSATGLPGLGHAAAAGLLAAAFGLVAAPLAAESEAEAAPDTPWPWELVLEWLEGERDRFADDLERAHGLLLERARSEDPALAGRLRDEPPAPRPVGYQILPELEADPPRGAGAARRQAYSLEGLTTAYTEDLRDAALLALEAERVAGRPLEPLVERFERLSERLENFEDHLGYHEHWQQSVIDYPRFFERKNEILARVEEWQALEKSGEDPERCEDLGRQVAEQVAPFQPAPGLAIETRPDGGRVLAVRVLTDIEDEDFRRAFEESVRSAYTESPAARERGLAIELTLEPVAPETLYPEGPPARGARIGEDEHVERFPADALVLTTGAKSTHAWTGRAIILGSAPIARRTLAHEFGHLLGFTDGYLRAHLGKPADRYGVVLVEWKNLLEGLMGAPSTGRVTPEMVETLLAAYGEADR